MIRCAGCMFGVCWVCNECVLDACCCVLDGCLVCAGCAMGVCWMHAAVCWMYVLCVLGV